MGTRGHDGRGGSLRGTAVVAVVVVAALFTPFAVSAAVGASTAASYAALGDSYTSGPFIPMQLEPYGCLRSDHNYPHLVAAAIGAQLSDVSCAGATTTHMTNPQGVWPGPDNPPQLSSLSATTQIVTLGIGGNDIHFSTVSKNCASLIPSGHPCQDMYAAHGTAPDTIDGWIAAAAPKVAAVLTQIHAASPSARVYLVGYPAIFPEQPLVPGGPEGCWPSLPLAPDDVPYLRAKQKALNAMLAAQVSTATGSRFVDTYTPSIGHDACEPPVVRWVEPAVPASPAAPVHPNLFGMQGMAAAVQAAIAAG